MNKQSLPQELRDAKRIIREKTAEFESRLMKASNAYFIVQILNEMQDIVEAEIYHWHNILQPDKDESVTLTEDLAVEGQKHLESLEDLVKTFNKYRAMYIGDALKIQQAMINSHQLKSPTISLDRS